MRVHSWHAVGEDKPPCDNSRLPLLCSIGVVHCVQGPGKVGLASCPWASTPAHERSFNSRDIGLGQLIILIGVVLRGLRLRKPLGAADWVFLYPETMISLHSAMSLRIVALKFFVRRLM